LHEIALFTSLKVLYKLLIEDPR